MRRTYRSKKDANGALDHKDVLQTMDEKSSAFDAYYIQNIKQTKREMSSVNFLAAPPNKVRKRKYVKRIIKDLERQKESVLDSVYLTPNKSLHVNKPLDPFDQLLNSSSNHQNDSLKVNKGSLFGLQNTAKTYRKKKVTKLKKYNYSGSDTTDSDKENSDNSRTPDRSNIKKHELLIENNTKKSPAFLDKSIKDLVQNFSMLKKVSPKTPKKLSKPFKPSKNRLTTNMQSPLLQNSPMCSTPFKEKYRGQSIYNFSPINSKILNDSLDTSHNKSNDSIILVSKKKYNLSNKKEISIAAEISKSPVFKTPDNHKAHTVMTEDCKVNLTTFKGISLYAESPQNIVECDGRTIITDDNVTKLHEHTTTEKECEKSNDKFISSVEISSLHTTEVEPFMGFCINDPNLKGDEVDMTAQNDIDDCVVHQVSIGELMTRNDRNINFKEDDPNRSITTSFKNKSDFSHHSHHTNNNNSLENSIMLFSDDNPIAIDVTEEYGSGQPQEDKYLDNSGILSGPFKETDQEINRPEEENDISRSSSNKSSSSIESEVSQLQNNTMDEQSCSKNSVVENDALVDSKDQSLGEDSDHIDSADQSLVEDSGHVDSADQSLGEDSDHVDSADQFFGEDSDHVDSADQSLGEDSDNQSFYDTCNSGSISQADSEDRCQDDLETYPCNKLPLVEIERLDDSIFQKYYDKMSECSENRQSQDSDDYESVSNISDLSNKSNENSDNVKESSNSDVSEDVSNDNENDSNSNTDEDRCISFVTTRRRNEVTNDSMILAFNDSYGSVSSLECDKTVLSNRNSNGKSDLNDVEATLVNKTDSNRIGSISEDVARSDTTRLSNVVTRKSARKQGSLLKVDEFKNEYIEPKPSIVLQPGKKWERSLSIYRRMTMMNDNFDESILEDEPMQCKGRKYRQSVISTMEMQDKSILHNESLNSRRSTFVSKPCRSTIKFVKEPNNSRISLCGTAVFDDLKGFLNEDCDDTIVELSKLSIADSEHEVTVLENFHDSAGRITTARDYVLRRCNQTEVLLFDECYPDAVLKNCHKIGEGVYGEVFLWRARDGRARVMKIVPIAGTIKVNGESQKDFHEIISEIVIAMELSALRAPIAEIDQHFDEGKDIDELDLHSAENATDVFNEVLAVRCVYGAYPSRLLDLWELYDECKGSENDSPAILPAEQQYIVLELANAGQDLESYQFSSAEQAHALFLQVAFALAVGEESYQFEHRDLHWGNVLIAPTDQKFATFVVRGRAHRVARRGVSATVIDYSLSRLALPPGAAALYNDLAADDGLFDARGDYQFDVYRRMRDKLGNDWKNFEPYTNILWLHYTVDKMITALRYKRTNTKIHKHYIAKLKGIKNRILDYGSAAQFVLTDNEI